MPDAEVLWRAVDQFHGCAMVCIRDYLARDVGRETQRLVRRSELTTAQTFESFDRLSAIVVRRFDRVEVETDPVGSPARRLPDGRGGGSRAVYCRSPAGLGPTGIRRCDRDRADRPTAGSPDAVAGRMVEAGRRPAGGLARRGAPSGRAHPRRERPLHHDRPEHGNAPSGRSVSCNGIGAGSRDVLSGAAVAPASISGSADLFASSFERQRQSYRRSPL